MIKNTREGIPFYEFEIFRDFAGILKHAVFTRHTDVGNKASLQKALEINVPPISFEQQMHGTSAHVIDEKRLNDKNLGRQKADVWITNQKNVPILIRSADCASIMLFDPTKKVIANIHAGWRGLAQKIICKTINKMRERFGCSSQNIFAGIGPMLGPCCSRFTDPQNELPKFLHQYVSEENFVNLWAITEGHLRECGLPLCHVENARICTFCNPEEFVSRRREKGTERFCTVIMLA